MPATRRVSRSAALARFRTTRAAEMDQNLEDRTSMILKVASDVADLVDQTRSELTEIREDRAARAQRLHAGLDSFRAELSDANAASLAKLRQDRASMAEADSTHRQEFMSDLKTAVVRICSEDFRVA